ncbi:MAG: S41 family peptidase [Dehalococcoidia bacterium]|nr:S41 family peptidase [Dehalococcoidia bacterium]MCB9485962.1 S41 family peptidase [Thermoflexaceae bacterium]
MQMPVKQDSPGTGEHVARVMVIVFLALATLMLAFALGFGVRELTDDSSGSASPAGGSGGSNGVAAPNAAFIDEIVQLLESQYVDRKLLNTDDLLDAAVNGVITSLNDRETHYIPPEDLKGGALALDSSYQGIGASVSDSAGEIRIVAPFRDSPAEQAGIRSGDAILEVDGEPTDGWTDSMAVERIRGPKGSTVTLTVRHTDGSVETLDIVRGEIAIDSVFREPNLEIIPGESDKSIVDRTGAVVSDICYLAISQFHDKTHQELIDRASDIEKSGCTGLILDLRSNPGGGLQATIDVTDEFLDEGTIIIEQDANSNRQVTSAKNGGILTKIKMVTLVDAGSASGAEVLAAALHDNRRSTTMGAQTFGKGTVNRLFPLQSCGNPDDCGAVYMSVGRWLTPNGDLIEGLGIVPDVAIEMTAEQYVDEGDVQIFAAIDFLRQKP